MSSFFLYAQAVDVEPQETFEAGVKELILTKEEASEYDEFMRHESIWEVPAVLMVLENPSEFSNAATKFIGQLTPIEDIKTVAEFDALYPNDCNGFLGIDFSGTEIPVTHQVRRLIEYHDFNHTCLMYSTFDDQEILQRRLEYVFPAYTFESEALDDLIQWNGEDKDNYRKAIDLIADIGAHPFTGGLGQTEVLAHSTKVASKRINKAHRVVYGFEGGIRIKRCRGHYD
jgi:toxin YoeB